jgi:hypothetical protein
MWTFCTHEEILCCTSIQERKLMDTMCFAFVTGWDFPLSPARCIDQDLTFLFLTGMSAYFNIARVVIPCFDKWHDLFASHWREASFKQDLIVFDDLILVQWELTGQIMVSQIFVTSCKEEFCNDASRADLNQRRWIAWLFCGLYFLTDVN